MDQEKDELAVNIKELDKDIVKANSFYRVFFKRYLVGSGNRFGRDNSCRDPYHVIIQNFKLDELCSDFERHYTKNTSIIFSR